ncbi:hypothetical protein E2542_SST09448 [Spatholobus suberectus]|nr:hypothetical protein E2542_SST09448 [Spatholobus suberectus]
MHIITGNVAPKEPDATESTLHVQLSAQAVNQQILRLRFVKLIATNLYAKLYAEVTNQTAMHQDQGVMTPVSLVRITECSTFTERAMNTSP